MTQGQKRLRGYLEASSFLGFISIWYGCCALRSKNRKSKINFDPISDVISDDTDKLLQHIKTRPGTIKRSFRIENRSSSLADSRGKRPPPNRLAGSGTRSEEFVNLQSLLVQSSIWFGVNSVQFSSLFTILYGKFVQFSSGYGGQVPPFSSFSSVQFSSQTFPVLTQIDLTGLVRLSISSVHRLSNCLRGVEEQF